MSRFKPLSVLVLVLCVSLALLSADQEKATYVCPMHCRNAVYDAPGNCSVCGMELIQVKDDHSIKVAILIFDGVQIIDFAAPWEVFGQAHFHVYTVAARKDAIITSMNMKVTPDFDFTDAPAPDVLLLPGGNEDGAIDDKPTLQWIRQTADRSRQVLSVCNGAFFLAKTGLLDGLTATTFYRLIPELAAQSPKTKVVSDRRFVDNGKIVTSAGLSSGIDASLYLVSKIQGMGEAQRLALHLEYNWQPDSKFTRASLADMNLPDIDLPNGWNFQYLGTQGDDTRWDLKARITASASLEEVTKFLESSLSRAKWTKVRSAGPGKKYEAAWRFSDPRGLAWNATLSLDADAPNTYVMALHLQRAA